MDDVRIQELKARNAKVEADKAWETSWLRKGFIVLATYIIAVFYMKHVGLGNPYLGAFVPSGGYLLSTMSLPFIKNYWIKNIYKNKK